MPPTAVVLVAHGSPDPDWRRPLVAVADGLRASLQRSSTAPPPVVLAYLGFLEPSIDDAIAELYAAGHRHILVLAAFLSPGGKHIKRDVPDALAALRTRYPDLTVELRPGSLGAEPEVVDALVVAAARALGESTASKNPESP